jgi:hypothetical protein
MKKKKTIIKTISIDPDVHTKIEQLRITLRRSYSAQVSFILDEYFREKGDKDEKTEAEKI